MPRLRVLKICASVVALLSVALVAYHLLAQQPHDANSPKALARSVRWALPSHVRPAEIVISPEGNHFAYVDKVDGKQVVVLDGKPGTPYEKIRAPWFEREPVIGDDRPNYSGLFFSPNGKRLAYGVIRYTGPNGEDWYAGRQSMVIDGVEGKAYSEVSIPVFSPDSQHVAYVANTGTGCVVVMDDQELGPYEEIGGAPYYKPEIRSVVFAPQGSRIAYAVRKRTKWYVMVDGREGPAYTNVFHITFSPDGNHVAHVAMKGHLQTRMVVDGKEDGLQFMYVGPPVFSPDSKRLAYSATKAYDSNVLVVDGQERPEYGCAGSPLFSPDSRRIAVVASSGGKRPFCLMVDGQGMLIAWQVLRPLFSPDSRHVACAIDNRQGTDARIAVDGKPLPYQTIGWPPVYSLDGSRMAYIASIDGKQAVVVDGKPLPGIDGWIYDLTFSPDGKHVVYDTHLKDTPGKTAVAVDGIAGESHQRIIGSHETSVIFDAPERVRIEHSEVPFFFDTPNRFHYFAIKDGAIHRVEATIPSLTHDTGWHGKDYEGFGLQVRAEVPKTFTIGSDAVVDIYFTADEMFRTDADTVEVDVTLAEARQPGFFCTQQRDDIPLRQLLEKGVYSFRMAGWWGPFRSASPPYAKPGPAQVTVLVRLRKTIERTQGLRSTEGRWHTQLHEVPVRILPRPANSSALGYRGQSPIIHFRSPPLPRVAVVAHGDEASAGAPVGFPAR